MPVRPRVLGARPVAERRAATDRARSAIKPSRRWYGLARWKRMRARQLAAFPLCRFCEREGLTVAATVADHREPHREDERKFWEGDLQSLCAPCHSAVKQREEARR